MAQLEVLFPGGENIPEGFVERLLAVLPDDPMVRSLRGTLRRGLVDLLVAGYIIVDPHRTVVRLDTQEHPLDKICDLAKEAESIGGMIIGDLAFRHLQLIGRFDSLANEAYSTLFSYATAGKLSLSCAHGFQAFAPGVVGTILPFAIELIEWAEQHAGISVMKWQFDAAMALSALVNNVPMRVLQVEAFEKRDRPPEKILQQLQMGMALLRAAHALRPNTFFLA